MDVLTPCRILLLLPAPVNRSRVKKPAYGRDPGMFSLGPRRPFSESQHLRHRAPSSYATTAISRQFERITDLRQAENDPNWNWNGPALVIVEQPWLAEWPHTSARLQPAAAARQDDADALGFRAIGVGDDVAAVAREDIDRRPVFPARCPAGVDDAETGHPRRDATEQPGRHATVEARQPMRGGYLRTVHEITTTRLFDSSVRFRVPSG